MNKGTMAYHEARQISSINMGEKMDSYVQKNDTRP